MSQSAQWIAAARLLRRTGFGASGPAIDASLTIGTSRYVAAMLTADPAADPGAKATPPPAVGGVATGKAGKADRRDQMSELTLWWLERMAAVQQPFGEKLTFLWHDHFATSAKKVKNANWMLAQNETLRRLGRGEFRALAQAMLVDAAMLGWLDGEKNTVGAANENLSREFMELFALGHGGAYTEADVREGARALTGWRIEVDATTLLRPRQHDASAKTVLGVTGNLDQSGFCDAVLAQPGSARFIASTLWRRLASPAVPSPEMLDTLVSAYGPRRSLSGLISAILAAPAFTAAEATVVVTPVEWLIGAVRALNVPPKPASLAVVLKSLGQVPFYPPSVGGWPTGQAWLSTAAADVRIRSAAVLANAGDIDSIASVKAGERVDAAGYLLGVGAWTARSRAVLQAQATSPARLVAVALNTPEYLTH